MQAHTTVGLFDCVRLRIGARLMERRQRTARRVDALDGWELRHVHPKSVGVVHLLSQQTTTKAPRRNAYSRDTSPTQKNPIRPATHNTTHALQASTIAVVRTQLVNLRQQRTRQTQTTSKKSDNNTSTDINQSTRAPVRSTYVRTYHTVLLRTINRTINYCFHCVFCGCE